MQYNHHRSHACTLLCTALALAFGCAAAHAADVKISGSVITGLYFKRKRLTTGLTVVTLLSSVRAGRVII